MATNTEMIRALQVQTSVLEDRDARRTSEVHQLTANLNKLTETVHDLKVELLDKISILVARISVLETQVTELRKTMEEKDRRHWAFYTALTTCVITTIVNVVLVFVKTR